MSDVYNLGVLLVVQCENCKYIHQFNARPIEGQADCVNGYLIDRDSIFTALIALGWQHFRGRWFCKSICMEAKDQK